jgi:rod shape-determining protein MreC
VPAGVSGWTSSNFSSSFTINRGYANSNIEQGNAVVTEYGVLIGQVTNVGATSSTVVTILDTTFSASALVGEAGQEARLRGDFNYMRSGLLVLDIIDDNMVIMVGDNVITAGLGGILPPNLSVGEVTEIRRNITGIGRYAIVTPVRDISTIVHVVVITGFRDIDRDDIYE